MPLKRDFVLYGLVVVFLITGIVSTLSWQQLTARVLGGERVIETSEAIERTATLPVVPDEATLRQTRLEHMRAALAAEPGSELRMPTPVVVEEPVASETDPEPELPPVSPACPKPSPTLLAWNPRGLTLQESEGVLLVYREVAPPVMTGTTSTPGIVGREVVLQLPLRTFPDQSRCITTDVVGIAMDGSLIRNTETSLYGIFGSDTQVGYTLDGFPLYGMSGARTVGECGGTMVNGAYRYYVGTETILGCFMAEPMLLR